MVMSGLVRRGPQGSKGNGKDDAVVWAFIWPWSTEALKMIQWERMQGV